MRVLSKGMRGGDVRRWQAFLIAHGYLAGPADGIFGNHTERATQDFQRAKGLDENGIVGPLTRSTASEPEPAVTTGGATILHEAALKQIMPGIKPASCCAYAPFLQQAMHEFAIETPPRAAAFLAQLAHESGQLRFFEEIWGPTAAQRRYEPPSALAARLGNTQPGDGRRFKGRGPIQLTGRANYRCYGRVLGVDLIFSPALAATKEVGFRVAGLFWQRNGLNELADQQQFRRITRRINGGFNGLEDRLRFYERAKRVFGVVSLRALDDGGDGAAPLRFPRGLDAPGEITPTAVERSARRAAATRRPGGTRVKKPAGKGRRVAARSKTAARKTTGRTSGTPRPRTSRAATKGGAGMPARMRSRTRPKKR
jgi:putative chitinase